VMIDRDITRIAPEEIAQARVMMTVVGGRIIHSRE
jgi:predicted amidohydrolase YtcJ